MTAPESPSQDVLDQSSEKLDQSSEKLDRSSEKPATLGSDELMPILRLSGYKISNPTVLARIELEELEQFPRGGGWTPYFVEGDDPEKMHELMAATLEDAIEDIRQIQKNARISDAAIRPRNAMHPNPPC